MSKTTSSKGAPLPEPLPYGSLSHDHILESFLTVLNLVEPDHPYKTDPYPVSRGSVSYGYKKASSSAYASCGPKGSISYSVSFSADKEYFNDISSERILAILVHEVTHITVGSHSDEEHGAHPPRFWREFGFNAHIALDNWNALETKFGPLDRRAFIGHVVKDEVNPSNIDKRYGSVSLRRHEMARWFENTLR